MLAGCGGGADDRSTALPSTSGQAGLPTAQEVVDDFAAQGLAVANPSDTTERDCPSAGCSQALSTDQVAVLSFPTPGRAEIYGNQVGVFHVVSVALLFPDATPDADRARYEAALQRRVG